MTWQNEESIKTPDPSYLPGDLVVKAHMFDHILDRMTDWAIADRLECSSDYARKSNDASAFNDISEIVRDYYRMEGGCPYAD